MQLLTCYGQWVKKSGTERCCICNDYVANWFAFFWAGKGDGCEAITSLVILILCHPLGSCPLNGLLSGLNSGNKIPNSTGDDLNTFSCPVKVKGKTVCGSQILRVNEVGSGE